MIIVFKRGKSFQKWILDEDGRVVDCIPADDFYKSCTVKKLEYLRKGVKPVILHDTADKIVEHPQRIFRVIPTIKIKVITNRASLIINGQETRAMDLEEALRQISGNRYVLSNPSQLPAYFRNIYNAFPHTQF